MKDLILSNLINFVISNDITKENIIVNEHVDSFTSIYQESDEPMFDNNVMNNRMIWEDISSKLKLDDISVYLLENFSDTIENEDYVSSMKMKKEIYNRCEHLTTSNIHKIGKSYLISLRNGMKDSNTFSFLSESCTELVNIWKHNEITDLDFIIEELEIIERNMSVVEQEDITNEVIESINNDISTHPTLIIENTIQFFKLLKK